MNPYRKHIGHRVIVHLDNGLVFAGQLDKATAETVELSGVVAYEEATRVSAQRETVIDGTTVLERTAVNWMQVL